MGAVQWEPAGLMVDGGLGEPVYRMAGGAVRSRKLIGVRIAPFMARHALLRLYVERDASGFAVMAIGARYQNVPSLESKIGITGVPTRPEAGGNPPVFSVAVGADRAAGGLTELVLMVIRVARETVGHNRLGIAAPG